MILPLAEKPINTKLCWQHLFKILKTFGEKHLYIDGSRVERMGKLKNKYKSLNSKNEVVESL